MALSHKIFFGVILAVVATVSVVRFSGLPDFPIFNDETIYTQYSQLLAEDFGKFKFVSIDNVFRDWKPPLQYWLGSLSVNWQENPLLGVRLLSAIFWFLGAVGIYFLAAGIWTRKEGWFALLFYVLNPSVFFYGGQFIAEVYVWTTAIWLLVFLVGLMKRSIFDLRFGLIIGAAATGAALLLFKQASFLYFYLAWLWPLFFWPFRPDPKKDKKNSASFSGEWRLWRRNALSVWGVLAVSFVVYKLIIPAQLFDLEKQFTSRWTLGIGEIFSWPATVWSANLNLVWNFFIHYYSPVVLFLVFIFTFFAFYRRQREEIAVSSMFWLASFGVILGLRGFNEYLYHTAVIVFLILTLSRFSASFLDGNRIIGWRGFLKGLGLAAVIFFLIFWGLQIYLQESNPAGYLDRGTTWLRGNNLLSWANGFNVPILIEILEQRPDSSIAFVDPQWGNPGTALQVFQNYYPQVRIAPITADLFRPGFLDQLRSAGFQSRLAIFSKQGNAPDIRNQWQKGFGGDFCGEYLEFRTHNDQTPVVVCIF